MTQWRLDESTSIALKKSAHATMLADMSWQEEVVQAFKRWRAARSRKGRVFAIEDFRSASNLSLPSVNCWGAVPSVLRSTGLIRSHKRGGSHMYRPAKSVSARGRIVALYEEL